MRILYGVVGEGMGHATRSRVVLEHLLAADHEVEVVVSGRAHGFLKRFLDERPEGAPGRLTVREIHGLHLVYDVDGVDLGESIWSNLEAAPEGLWRNLRAYREVVGSFAAEVVVSDFESWAYLFGRAHDLPVISIDNMQVLNRCRHEPAIVAESGLPDLDFSIARLSVKAKLPGAYHYLVTSFFFPPVRKPRTTLVPPILRPEILAARREPGEHVLVYQTSASNKGLLGILSKLPHSFRVYGMGTDAPADLGPNVSLRPFSQQGFVDDLRTARAVVAGGGFSLMGEAVHLGVPMLSVPLASQFEQELNARYLARLGYGQWAPFLDEDVLLDFLSDTDRYSRALERYPRQDNQMLFSCLDELLWRVSLGEPRPDTLTTHAMGDILTASIDATLENG